MKPSRILPLLFLALAALLSTSLPAKAWWDGAWKDRTKLTLDVEGSDAVGTVTLSVRLNDSNFNFDAASQDGSDVRFVAADDKTVLVSHLEKFDSVNNQALAWVKVPDVKPGTKTVLYLYYGNPKAAAPETKGSFDPETVLAYHFGESGPAADATGNGNSAQAPGIADGAGLIGTGLRLIGNPIPIPASPSLAWNAGDPLTLSIWVKYAAPQPNAVLFSRQDGGGSFQLGIDNGIPYVEIGGQRTAPGTPLAPNGWKLVSVVVSGSQTTLYLDGVPYGTVAAGLPTVTATPILGGDAANDVGFSGSVDELEISKAARSPGFLKVVAANQGPDADAAGKLLGLDKTEQHGNWFGWISFGYFGVIFGSIGPDSWIIILCLVAMGYFSGRVFVRKFKHLNVLQAANAKFTEAWRLVGTDLTILEDEVGFKSLGGRITQGGLEEIRQGSSLYRIYHVGALEIRKRFTTPDGRARVLSAQSIEAIRSSLDGAYEQENEEIDHDIVVMRNSITGGPYIGLFGTVIGVIIVFAVVAQAGEVNVNAIAPGISSCLVATAMGLLVAIPSMFGYNYLATRIRKTRTKMKVFIDEFVTKIAEFYDRPRGA